jgi:hypothetical protein
MTTPSDEPGKPDDEPKSRGGQPGDDTSKLLGLNSLQSYFNDSGREPQRIGASMDQLWSITTLRSYTISPI